MDETFLAGYADVEFTPEPGLPVFGQMHRRIGERIRDPLTACAAAYAEAAGPPAVVVAVDVCVLDSAFVLKAREQFAERSGLPGERLLIHATHTHVAPSTLDIMAGQTDADFMERLLCAVVGAAAQAVERLEPCALYAGTGCLEQMGWNRRAMFADGTSRMYGNALAPGFVEMEGPRDPALPVLFTRRADGTISGVLLGFSTHPNAIEGACLYSADIPGAVRRALRRLLGGAGVVYMTGAAGNTAPSVPDNGFEEQPWRGEEGLERSGLYVAGEAAKVIAGSLKPMTSPKVRLARTVLRLPLRPWPAPDAPNYPAPLRSEEWGEARSYYAQAEADWPRKMAEEDPTDVPVSVLRLGDAALCANPAELFVEYGLAIREASPARVTLVAELTDGYTGYVPTPLALSRGGYETWPCPTSKMAADAGERIVEGTRRLLTAAFAE